MYPSQKSLWFFLHPSRVLRSCQRLWQDWPLWRRSWSTWNQSDGRWIWKSCTNLHGMCWGNPSSIIRKPKVGYIYFTNYCNLKDRFSSLVLDLCLWEFVLVFFDKMCYEDVFSVSWRRGRSQSVEGRSSIVQLHSTQLFCVLAWGAQENRCHFLAELPPSETLWWELYLLLSPLLWLPVCSRQGHKEVPWGKYQADHEIQWTCNNNFVVRLPLTLCFTRYFPSLLLLALTSLQVYQFRIKTFQRWSCEITGNI